MNTSMISDAVERLFSENVDPEFSKMAPEGVMPLELWKLMEVGGFIRVLAPEHAGGLGETWQTAYPIFRGIGYWQAPVPLAETMIAAHLLGITGMGIPDGPIALVEQVNDSLVLHGAKGGPSKISGLITRVAWARHCRWALISTNDQHLHLIDLHDQASVNIVQRDDHAGCPIDDVVLDGADVLQAARLPVPCFQKPIWTLGAAAYSAMMVGALESLLTQTLQHVSDRVQFGRTLGKNQAVQQQVAVMAGEVSAARIAALTAMSDLSCMSSVRSGAAQFSTAVAKVRAGEAAGRCAAIAHQMHGAIGFTKEHRLHYASTRLWAWREAFGDGSHWSRELGRQAITSGSAQFWQGITARSFKAPVAPNHA